MFQDYSEFAANFSRQCRERRAAEEARRCELDELVRKPRTPETKTTTETSPAAKPELVNKVNGAGAGLVFKTNPDARVVDARSKVAGKTHVETSVTDDDTAELQTELSASAYATANTPADNPYPWWTWVERYCEYRASHLTEVLGQLFR